VKYKLAIFDLDGTLLDSFPWFCSVLNDVAERHGFRRVEPDQVDTLRGSSTMEIIRFLGIPMWKVPAIAQDMRHLKSEHLDAIPLFPGVDAMLRHLAGHGVTLALVSSDHEENVRRALGSSNAGLIKHYACGAALFGKAAKFKRIMKTSGVPSGQTICIGDETRDIEAAQKAGVACGAVAWGYATEAALRARAPAAVFSEINDILEMLCPPQTSRSLSF
jgi:phosphoglycolate phosphatase